MAPLDRRTFLTNSVGAVAAGTALGQTPCAADQKPVAMEMPPVRFCLNTSTVREHKLSLEEEIDLVAQAGYDGIEPWISQIDRYVESGRPLSDLRKRIADAGLRVESAIGFGQWIVDDERQRALGLDQMKRDMERLNAIGGTHIAAPPIGMQQADAPRCDLFAAADRYRTLLEVGREQGVIPQLEIWGFSRNLSRLGEVLFVAAESGDTDACLLPDVYHIYRGGSRFEGLSLLVKNAIHCFHFNDYPAQPSRAELTDAHRVYPGDGVAPWPLIVGILKAMNYDGAISLELFNREYWAQDPRVVAETGLKKMKSLWFNNAG